MKRHSEKEPEILQEYMTPATPGKGTVIVNWNDVCFIKKEQFKYKSAVGMILFLVKCSRQDIANAVRELSKCNDKENDARYKQMLRTVKYFNTKNRMLKFIPEKNEKNGNLNACSRVITQGIKTIS